MKFVIVENDEKTQKVVKSIIVKETFKVKSDYSVKIFSSYNKELKDLINDTSVPKIFILDIDLDDSISGIEIGKRIREIDWQSHIIYITNHDKMFEQTYRDVLEVFDFVEKFHNMNERLTNDIRKIINKEYDNSLFVYSNRNIDLHIYLKEILYIERDTNDRKLIIHTVNNEFIINLSLQEMLARLDKRFKRTHKSCIVNINRVTLFDWKNKQFVLDNNSTVNLLSKKYRKEVQV